jgi:uncharacterized membrane-anchored protein YjiN (DUF445 family)
MKELLMKILENHGNKILYFFVGLICMFVFFFFTDLLQDEIKKRTLQEEVVKPVATVSTSKSKKFLECIYDQLECYNKNAGLSREVILEACRDIDYCDQEGKK